MKVDYLRLSITDRCNLRCVYCMPPQGVAPRKREEILRHEEFAAFARAAAQCGFGNVRITGGEPLVRRDCAELVGMLAGTGGIRDISLTTNGVLLPLYAAELRRQGLCRVSISLDSLHPQRFAELTRGGRLHAVLAGLESALDVGLTPVKINVLLLGGVEDELDGFVELTRDRDVHVRFIEYMQLGCRLPGGKGGLQAVPGPRILRRLKREHGMVPGTSPYGHGPARYWRVPGAAGTIGFVMGVSDHFCDGCTRMRLTSDGRLRSCLFSEDGVNVRPFLGKPDVLRQLILSAVAAKGFDRCREASPDRRVMSQIGG